jgi:tetratricopeptide (TPR) repeat protein
VTEATLDNFDVVSHHIPSSLIRRRRWHKRGYPCLKPKRSYVLKEFKKAENSIEKALEFEPDNFWSLVDKCLLYIMKEKIDEAEKLLGRVEKINPGYSIIPYYKSIIFALKGDKNRALALKKNGLIYALLNMKDKAIKYIEDQANKDYEHYQYSYLLLKNSPFYDNLRDDARFEEIVRKQKHKYEERLKKFGDL